MNDCIPIKDRIVLWKVPSDYMYRCEVIKETAKTLTVTGRFIESVKDCFIERIHKSDIGFSVFYTKDEAEQCLLNRLCDSIKKHELQIEFIRGKIDKIKRGGLCEI